MAEPLPEVVQAVQRMQHLLAVRVLRRFSPLLY